MNQLTIVIPVYLRQDLHLEFTRETIASIRASKNMAGESADDFNLLLVKNFSLPKYEDELRKLGTVVDNPKGNNVPASWNLGIRKAIEDGARHILVANNDLLFHPLCLFNLLKFSNTHPEFALWTAAEYSSQRNLKTAVLDENFDEHPHFSCFMISPDTIERLKFMEQGTKEPFPGLFDETFEMAYLEDNDYHQRLLRAHLRTAKTGSALFYHYGSRTIKVDTELDIQNGLSYERNRQYFISKWGFDVHSTVVPNDDLRRFAYKEPFEPK